MDKQWHVRFRPFPRGRRSIKNAIVTAENRPEVREMMAAYFRHCAPQGAVVSIFAHREG